MVTVVTSERSQRIEKLKESVRPKKYPLCVEKTGFTQRDIKRRRRMVNQKSYKLPRAWPTS